MHRAQVEIRLARQTHACPLFSALRDAYEVPIRLALHVFQVEARARRASQTAMVLAEEERTIPRAGRIMWAPSDDRLEGREIDGLRSASRPLQLADHGANLLRARRSVPEHLMRLVD